MLRLIVKTTRYGIHLSHVPQNVLKSWCTASPLGTERINKLEHFSPNEMLAVNRVPIKSGGTIQCLERLALSSFPARAVPGSCTHARWLRSKLSLQRALSNLSQRCMMWECSLQSPRCFQSAGFLLSFSSAPSTTSTFCWSEI